MIPSLPSMASFDRGIIFELSPLQLLGLRALDIAVKHLHKAAAPSSEWLKNLQSRRWVVCPGHGPRRDAYRKVNDWVLLHLNTLAAQQPYLPRVKVEKLEWSDTPEKVHIARARLDFYDSLADVGHTADKGSTPDPGLLKVFLWSKDHGVCTRAFKWCLDLFPIGESGTPGDVNSTRTFIPESMGHMWVTHFFQVLCGNRRYRNLSWRLMISDLVPKWTMLPSSWCCDFASALIFDIVLFPDIHDPPAYSQFLPGGRMSLDERRAFLSFLATLLELIKSRLTWDTLTSLEIWLAQLPEGLENQDPHNQAAGNLATLKQQIVEQTLGFFAELPMENEWLEETLEFLAELPMAGEWMGE